MNPHPSPLRRPDAAEVVIALLAFVFALSFYVLRSQHRETYYAFVREDSIAESLQALFYLAATVVAAVASRRLLVRNERFLGVLFALFALGTFLIFGEEISWGQRLVGWESTEYFKARNMQEETNLHNDERLKHVVHPIGIAIGIYALLSPFLHLSFVRRGARRLSFFTSEWPLLGYFACFTGIYLVYEYLNPFIRPWYRFDLFLWQDLEMAESFLASGIFFWTVLKLRAIPRLFPTVQSASAPAAERLPRPLAGDSLVRW